MLMSAKMHSRVVPAVIATAWVSAAQAVPFVIEGATVSTSGVTLGTTVTIEESAGLEGRYYDLTAAAPTSKLTPRNTSPASSS